jgi:hypothetical protein
MLLDEAALSMNGKSPHRQRSDPTFVAWLAHNPTGIPRRQALGRAAFGVLLGLLGGWLVGEVVGFGQARPLWALSLGIAGGAIGGATIGALGVVLLARAMDRFVLGGDSLIGYSGAIRMLLHAGELSALGALSGGIGGGAAGMFAGLGIGALGGGALGGIIYQIRGLGTALGITVGVVAGAIGGALGGAIGGLGGS